MTTGTDTALAHRLLEAGLVDPLLLQGCLGEVRTRRGADPEVSLALLLVERRIVPPEQLEALLYGRHVSLEDAGSAALPERFGEFEVVRELERGGMGAVLEVRGPQGNRLALKTLLPGATDSELLARFQREAELTARLDHPHVVRIHAAALEARPPYLVIDHLPGGTLQERITRANGLPLPESLSVALKLASALQHAHARGVLHRDLKPENVLFDDRGEPRIIDWGLARSVADVSQHLTRTGTLLGTPAYMAPEQALAVVTVGPGADVYSLGAVLFACLCGKPPFSAPQLLATLDKVIHAPPPRPSSAVDLGALAPGVDALMARLLAKDPAERPTLSELSEELRSLARGDVAPRPAPTWLPYVVIGLLILVSLALAVALGTAPDPEALRQDYLAWENAHLSGYSLDVAPVPSAAELKAARERFLELRVSDEQNSLSQQRFSAYEGLLNVLDGRKAPKTAGAPGAVLAAVEAYRGGDLRATHRHAKRALSLAQVGGPERAERAAALFLLVRSASDLRELQRLQAELSIEEGRLRAALEARGAELLVQLLKDFPREGEAWSSATHRVSDEVAMARSIDLPGQAWWAGFDAAAPRWSDRLNKVRSAHGAEDVAFALERLDPPGVGHLLRRALQETIDRFANRSEALESDATRRQEMHQTLAIALRLDDALAYVDPSYVVTPSTRDIACTQHNGLDPGSSPELSTDCALFAIRNSIHLSLSDIRSHINSARLKLLLARRPRPRSKVQAFARILDTSRGKVEDEASGMVRQRAAELSTILEAEPRDVSPAIRSLASLWLAEHYEYLASRPGADILANYLLADRWARLALPDLPERKRGHNTVQVTQHLARLVQHRAGPGPAAGLWIQVLGELRLELDEHPEGEPGHHGARLSLVWALLSLAHLRLENNESEVALRLGGEAERLTYRRHGWESWLPRAYEIQALAHRALGDDKAAWAALHLEPELFGSSTRYAQLTLELGSKVGQREAALRAFHAAFLRPFPNHERDSRKRNLTLDPAERAEVLALATELGYPPPPKTYGER